MLRWIDWLPGYVRGARRRTFHSTAVKTYARRPPEAYVSQHSREVGRLRRSEAYVSHHRREDVPDAPTCGVRFPSQA